MYRLSRKGSANVDNGIEESIRKKANLNTKSIYEFFSQTTSTKQGLN